MFEVFAMIKIKGQNVFDRLAKKNATKLLLTMI